MKLKTVIIDDEAPSRNYLRNLINEFTPHLDIVGEADSVESGAGLIKKCKPDVVLLDIQLGSRNGFELLEQLEERKFSVIFITAYEQYAIKAIRHAALDYLLKPVSPPDFIAAVNRIHESHPEDNPQKLEFIATNGHSKRPLTNIILPAADELVFIALKEIISIEGSNNYSIFKLADMRQHVVSKNIHEYEDLLTESGFFRVHKSHMINLSHIKKYVKGRGGFVVMSDSSEIVVSARKKDEFLSILHGMI